MTCSGCRRSRGCPAPAMPTKANARAPARRPSSTCRAWAGRCASTTPTSTTSTPRPAAWGWRRYCSACGTTPRRCRCLPCCWGTLTPNPTRRNWPRCLRPARRWACAMSPAGWRSLSTAFTTATSRRPRSTTYLPRRNLAAVASTSGATKWTGSTFRTITGCAPRGTAGTPPPPAKKPSGYQTPPPPRRFYSVRRRGRFAVLRRGAQQVCCTRRMPSGLSHTRTSATGACCACSQASRSTASFTRAPSNAQTSA